MTLMKQLCLLAVPDKPGLQRDRYLGSLKSCALGVAFSLAIIWWIPPWIRSLLFYTVAVYFLSAVVSSFIISWKPKWIINPDGKAVIITGCDTGFGHMLAQELDNLGFKVFAGCLFPEGEGAKELIRKGSSRMHVVDLDVTKGDSVQNLVQYVNQRLKDNILWSVVCNAGINDGGEINWTSQEIFQRVFDVNAFGAVRVTKAFLPQLCKEKGRVVIVTSMSARYTFPGVAAYAVSKHAARSFADGLRHEMYRFGVDVIAVEPHVYKTKITDDDVVKRCALRSWDSAPDEIKEIYEAGHIEESVRKVQNLFNFSRKGDPREVVKCLVEAVTVRYPKYCYSPGTFHVKILSLLIQIVPKAISDKLVLDASLIDYN